MLYIYIKGLRIEKKRDKAIYNVKRWTSSLHRQLNLILNTNLKMYNLFTSIVNFLKNILHTLLLTLPSDSLSYISLGTFEKVSLLKCFTNAIMLSSYFFFLSSYTCLTYIWVTKSPCLSPFSERFTSTENI